MKISDENAFNRFLEQNARYWGAYRPTDAAKADRYIVVDVMHDYPSYLHVNLLVAKYIQQITGAKILAVTKQWATACPNYNANTLFQFSSSFEVDEFLNINQWMSRGRSFPDVQAAFAEFERRVSGLSGDDIRRAIFDFQPFDDPDVGRMIYDTAIRTKRCATIEFADDFLFESAWEILAGREAARRLFERIDVVATVMGHIEYSPYFFFAAEAVKRGSPTYFQWPLVVHTFRRFDTLEELRRGRSSRFLDVYERDVRKPLQDSAIVNEFARGFTDRFRGGRAHLGRAANVMAGFSREDFFRLVNLDPAKPTVCLLSHALSDAVHSYGNMLFDDFGQWLRRSLEIAERHPQVNFVLKVHPRNTDYDRHRFIPQLARIFGNLSNVGILPWYVDNADVLQHCKAVVTVHGTPGFELAVAGCRTITAGETRYSGLGFTLEPDSVGHYEALLSQAGSLSPLSAEERRSAEIYAFFEIVAGRSHTLFVPLHFQRYFAEAELTLRSRYIEEDPLFRNMRSMILHKRPFLLNEDVMAAAGVPGTAARPALTEV